MDIHHRRLHDACEPPQPGPAPDTGAADTCVHYTSRLRTLGGLAMDMAQFAHNHAARLDRAAAAVEALAASPSTQPGPTEPSPTEPRPTPQSEAATSPQPPQYQPAPDPFLAFYRITRAVQIVITTETTLQDQPQTTHEDAARERAVAREERHRYLNRKRHLRDLVTQSIVAKTRGAINRRFTLINDFDHRIDDPDIPALLEARTDHEAAAILCNQLGIEIDYTTWRDKEVIAAIKVFEPDFDPKAHRPGHDLFREERCEFPCEWGPGPNPVARAPDPTQKGPDPPS